jgi:hypothetical protein
MPNTRACGHALDVARLDHRFIAQAILMRDLPLQHDGNDFHFLMRVRPKAGLGLDNIIVKDPQRPPLNIVRIIILREGK